MIGTDINLAVKNLQEGKLVAIPTETVYGLAANAFNPDAVAQIYAVKNRPSFNPLIIHTDSLEKLEQWGLVLPEKMRTLAAIFSPGPLTYVIPAGSVIPELVTAGTQAVAVRIPNHPVTLELLSRLDFPVAAPSANPSGFVSPTTALHVQTQLGNQISYILDGGPCTVGVESTIVSFLQEPPELLRYGAISEEQIQHVIGAIIDKPATSKNIITDNPVAPGQLAKHYATTHRLIHDNPLKHINQYSPERIAIISLNTEYEGIPIAQQKLLSKTGNLAEAAQQLFATMREIDTWDIDIILAEVFPDTGVGKAINDRLKRASNNQ